MSNFEERLLSALKEEITMRTAENGATTGTSSRRRFAGLTAAVAGVAAAATAVVIGFSGGPAFAVDKGADGSVSVQISSFTDPDGLEVALADAGVKAVVDYLPEGQACKEPRGLPGSVTGRFATKIGSAGNGIAFTIEEGTVPAGETLVLAVSKSREGDDKAPFSVSLNVVKGAVADCEPTAAPVPPGADSGGATGEDGGPALNQRTDSGTVSREDGGPGLNQRTE